MTSHMSGTQNSDTVLKKIPCRVMVPMFISRVCGHVESNMALGSEMFVLHCLYIQSNNEEQC